MGKRTLGIAEELEIVALYEAGETQASITQKTGISNGTIWRTLDRHGIAKKLDGRSRPRVSAESKAEALEACRNGMPADRAAARFGLSESTMDRLLRKHGVSMRDGRPPSCEVNHAAFDVLTPEALYWLGFLFTDGSVSSDGYGAPTVSTGLQARDAAHVEKFRAFIGSTHKISVVDSTLGGKIHKIGVRSQQMANALARVGMNMTGKPYKVPSAELCASRDFWRGCIDGDGSVRLDHDVYPQILLVGRNHLLIPFQQYVGQHVGRAEIRPCQTIFRITLSGQRAVDLVRLLYENATIALDRKQKKAEEIMSDYRYR